MGYLRVENVGKAYKRYPQRWNRLLEWLSLDYVTRHELKWILQGVSFEIRPGEAVGIIGKNGAGKSTLLKMITGTTQPTEGTIRVMGRVAALLELGMGFHPEFTGRQNVYMAGQLLGFTTAEIDKSMPEIEGFAEIGSYLDEPVRTYSSGMQVRLAFSVATAIRPDILIVDEALAVGDIYFQHKCISKIRQFKQQGVTLLFVSHDAGAVKTLCDRALLLDEGRLVKDGNPEDVLDYYNALIVKHETNSVIRQSEALLKHGRSTRSGNRKAIIESVDALENGKSARAFRVGDSVTIRVRISVVEDLPDLTVGVLIRDRLGNDVFGTNTYHLGLSREGIQSGTMTYLDFVIPSLDLGVGHYSVTIALHSRDTHLVSNYDWWDQALALQVIPGSGPTSIGTCNLELEAVWTDLI